MRSVIICFFVFLLFLSCAKEEYTPRQYPFLEGDTLVEVTRDGVRVAASLALRGSQPIEEYGVYWDTESFLNRDRCDKRSFAKCPQDTFSVEITHGLTPGKQYCLWPFVRTKDFFVAGRPIVFKSFGSKPPVLLDVKPECATWNDTLFVKGVNLSKRITEFKAYIGGCRAIIMPKNDSLLLLRVPPLLDKSPCQVQLVASGNKIMVPGTFSLEDVTVDRIESDTICPGSRITLYGKGLHCVHSKVYFSGIEAINIKGAGNELDLLVPFGIHPGWNPLLVTSIGNSYTQKKGVFWDFALEKVIPGTVASPREVRLVGRGLGGKDFHLFVNEREVNSLKVKYHEVIFEIPREVKNGWNSVTVMVGENKLVLEKAFYKKYPIVESVSPLKVFCGETLEIRGKNLLDKVNGTTICVGSSTFVKPVFQSDTLLKIIVPEDIQELPGKVQVRAFGQIGCASKPLEWKKPIIRSVEISDASVGQYVTIRGEYLSHSYKKEVYFGGIPSDDISGTSRKLIARIPWKCPLEAELKVEHQGVCGSWNLMIHLKKIFGLSFSKSSFFRGGSFEIKGQNLNNSYTRVELINTKGVSTYGEVFYRDGECLRFRIPRYYGQKDLKQIRVSLGVQKVVYEVQQAYWEPWSELPLWSDYTDHTTYYTTFMVAYNGFLFGGLGELPNGYYNKKFWRIDVVNGKRVKMASFPGEQTFYPTGCVMNDHLFCATSGDENVLIYKYDSDQNSWSYVNMIQGGGKNSYSKPFLKELEGEGILVVNNKIYSLNGQNGEINEICHAPVIIMGGFKGSGNLYLMGSDNNLYRFDRSIQKVEMIKRIKYSNVNSGVGLGEKDGKAYLYDGSKLIVWDLDRLEPYFPLGDYVGRDKQGGAFWGDKLYFMGGGGYNRGLRVFSPVIQDEIDAVNNQN